MAVLSLCADYDPLPHIPVVEMVSEDEASEVESLGQFPPKLVSNAGWVRSGGRARAASEPHLSVSPQRRQLDQAHGPSAHSRAPWCCNYRTIKKGINAFLSGQKYQKHTLIQLYVFFFLEILSVTHVCPSTSYVSPT